MPLQAALVALLCALTAAAQPIAMAPGAKAAARSTFRLDVKLIEVPVNVTALHTLARRAELAQSGPGAASFP